MVGMCWSTAGVPAKLVQSLVPFTSGGIVPVQVTVTVWPLLEGTVMLLVAGVEAKLTIASKAPIEQRLNAKNARGLKIPDSEVDSFCMIGLLRGNWLPQGRKVSGGLELESDMKQAADAWSSNFMQSIYKH
jgi:hypothetical protein